jgi:putative membrane protein
LVKRLTADEKAHIHAAVMDAESRTHVHVAVSVVPASDRYLLYPLVWAAIAALLAGGALAVGWPRFPSRETFAVEAILFVVLSLLFEWLPLRLALVPGAIRRHRAQALAHREFAARILASHERKGGVLLFVSLGERYAEILADRETHMRIGAASWDRILADYLADAKNRPVADAIVKAVHSCAAVLGESLTTA